MRFALVAAFLLSAGLAGCASEGDFAPVANPGWLPGYGFVFTAEGTHGLDVDIQQGSQHVEQSDTEPFGPTDYLSLRVVDAAARIRGTGPLYLALANSQEARDAFQAPDKLEDEGSTMDEALAFSPADLSYSVVRIVPGCTDCPPSLEQVVGEHPMARFPLARGSTWTTRGVRMPGNSGIEATATAEVGGLVTVDGPTGPVEAIHVHHAFAAEQPDLSDVPPGYEVHRLDIDLDAAADVYFAPSLHAIVLQEVAFRVRSDVDVTTPQGRVSGHATETLDYTLRLTGYDLTVRAATPLSGVPALLGTAADVPKGTGVAPAAGALNATGSTQRAQVGDPAVVLSASGANLVPGSLAWEVRDGLGKVRRVAQGERVTFPTTEPGSFTAIVKATDQGGQPLEARFGFAVDLHGPRTMACGLVVPTRPCAPVAVPISAGLQAATIRATRTAAAPAAGEAALELRQAGQVVASAPFAGGTATVALTGPVATNGWEVAYAAAFDSTDLDLDLDLTYELPRP